MNIVILCQTDAHRREAARALEASSCGFTFNWTQMTLTKHDVRIWLILESESSFRLQGFEASIVVHAEFQTPGARALSRVREW